MAEKGEKRDPSSHRTPGQVKRLVKGYDAKPKTRKARAQRNAARAKAMKQGKVSKGDGKDVAHKKPISKGGTNDPGNVTVQSQKKNRGWEREKGGASKPSRSG